MIWEPFVLALVLGLVVSVGLYFAYLWPSVEPAEPTDEVATPPPSVPPSVASEPITESPTA